MGINMTAMAMKILIEEPEYQIMRDRDANTAVSSLAITLPQAKTGARKKVKTTSRFSRFAVLSICLAPAVPG